MNHQDFVFADVQDFFDKWNVSSFDTIFRVKCLEKIIAIPPHVIIIIISFVNINTL